MSISEKILKDTPRMVILITQDEDKKKLEELFDNLQIPICYQCRGKGTAPSEMLDIFGLGGTTRLITIGLLPRSMVQELTKAAERKMSFHQKGGGIVLSVPITGLQSPVYQMLNDDARKTIQERAKERMEQDMAEVRNHMEYVLILVSVVGGYSDEVIDAARAAGAKGGTVLKGRQRHSERISQRLGLSVQEERDFVMIAVPREEKGTIMSAIGDSCGLTSPAHGVILSLPVDQVVGLET